MAVASGGVPAGTTVTDPVDVGISSEDLFRNAMEPEAPADAPEPGADEQAGAQVGRSAPGLDSQPQPQPGLDELQLDAQGRLRNAQGQFASPQQVAEHTARQAGQPQPQPGQQQPGQPQPGGDDDAMVPSWRLREEREQREALQNNFAAMQQQYDRMLGMIERMQQGSRPQQAPAPAPDLPDPVIDPVGYRQGLEAQFNHGLRAVMLENNLRMTSLEVGKQNFEAAYNAFLAAGQAAPDFARSVVNSPDPGERIMSWYNNQRVLQEIGGDPQAWMARQLEQALANPQFLARAVEAATNQARGMPAAAPAANGRQQPQQQPRSPQQPRNVTVLPPSLMNMRGASAEGGGEQVDYGHGVSLSDDDLFRGAMAPAAPRR